MVATHEQQLRERREAVVLEHVSAENRHDVEATIATFDRPRYEVNGELSDGETAVRELLNGLMTGFPDVHGEIGKLHHADDAVIGEVQMTGTHDGLWSGVPATRRGISFPLVCIFEFEGDRLVCEKVFFDVATILHQVGVIPEPGSA